MTTPGHYIATELIDAKAQGRQFKHADLSAFIDVCLEKWNQTNGFTLTQEAPAPVKIDAEAIYQAYPRKIGKKAALKAIAAAITELLKENAIASGVGMLPRENAAAWLHGATRRFAAAVATWPARDRAFIPHPATWFNRGSYLDDPTEWQRGHASTANTTPRDYTKL